MRRISVTCTVLQSIYLALFTVSYTVNTIYYLPFLWSINASIGSFHFVRNRRYLTYKLFQCKQKFKYNVKEPIQRQTSLRKLEATHSNEPQSDPRSQETTETKTTKFSDIKELPLDFQLEDDAKSTPDDHIVSDTISSTVSKEPYRDMRDLCEHQRHNTLPHSRPHMRSQTMKDAASSSNQKALKLLGISSSTKNNPLMCRNNPSIPRKRQIVHSQSDIVTSPSASSPDMFYPASPKKIQPVYSKTDPLYAVTSEINDDCDVTHVNIVNTDKKKGLQCIEEVEGSDEINDESKTMETTDYMSKLPLRRISSPSAPRDSLHPNIKIDIEHVEYDDAENEDDDECRFVDYNENRREHHKKPEPEQDSIEVIIDETEPDVDGNKNTATKPMWFKHPQLSHRKSNSDPCGLNDSSMNLGTSEAMENLERSDDDDDDKDNDVNNEMSIDETHEDVDPPLPFAIDESPIDESAGPFVNCLDDFMISHTRIPQLLMYPTPYHSDEPDDAPVYPQHPIYASNKTYDTYGAESGRLLNDVIEAVNTAKIAELNAGTLFPPY